MNVASLLVSLPSRSIFLLKRRANDKALLEL